MLHILANTWYCHLILFSTLMNVRGYILVLIVMCLITNEVQHFFISLWTFGYPLLWSCFSIHLPIFLLYWLFYCFVGILYRFWVVCVCVCTCTHAFILLMLLLLPTSEITIKFSPNLLRHIFYSDQQCIQIPVATFFIKLNIINFFL